MIVLEVYICLMVIMLYDYLCKEKKFGEALDWYNCSLSLYNREESGDQNLARLHRNRATCYLNLGQMEKVANHC